MTITKTFDRPGDFNAERDAEKYLSARGFSIGSSQGPERRGILFGDFVISKWRGFSKADIQALHGIMRGDGRNGPVYIDLFDSAPEAAKRVFDSDIEELRTPGIAIPCCPHRVSIESPCAACDEIDRQNLEGK
jgi:hypothetical protein